MKDVIAIIDSAIGNNHKGYVCATGVHGIMESQKDATLRTILNNCLINVPDGRPTVWVGRLQGHRRIRQVTGPNLMLKVCELSAKRGYTQFLYGGNVGVAQQLRDALVARYPDLKVVGTYTPPFRPLSQNEEDELLNLVARLKPDIFWVGLSTPKQERFVATYIQRLQTKVVFAVGAAFDLHTGRIRECPEWVKTLGMQWFHRLCQEPQRLWKRYLLNNPQFIAKVAVQLLGLKKYELLQPAPSFGAPACEENFYD